MKTRCTFAVPYLITLALAGCASAPPADLARVAVKPPTCAQLAAQRAIAEDERLGALEEERNAWKAVLPIVVAAKFAQGRADARAAEERISNLQAESSRLGCAA
jgi:hypothetical protein